MKWIKAKDFTDRLHWRRHPGRIIRNGIVDEYLQVMWDDVERAWYRNAQSKVERPEFLEILQETGEELKEGGGMKTKEEILDKHIFNKFDDADRATFLAAMDEYAAQFAGTREDWVSVEKELPPKNELVLVIRSNGYMLCKDWEPHTNQDESWFRESFTHWRKLPNPPNTNILKPI